MITKLSKKLVELAERLKKWSLSQPSEYLLVLGAVSVFSTYEKAFQFADWIARVTEYWGTFWAWVFNAIIEALGFNFTISQQFAYALTAMIFLMVHFFIVKEKNKQEPPLADPPIWRAALASLFIVSLAFPISIGIQVESERNPWVETLFASFIFLMALLGLLVLIRRIVKNFKPDFDLEKEEKKLNAGIIYSSRVAIVVLFFALMNGLSLLLERVPSFPN